MKNKRVISADKLLALVEGYFAKDKFANSWVKKIWDGIVLRPGIGGLGVDVKKLLSGNG